MFQITFAQLISCIGDFAFIMGIQIWIYRLTGSGIAMSMFFVFHYIPKIFFSLLLGSLIDKINKKYTMIISDFLRAAALVLIIFIKSADQLYLLYIAAFILSTFTQTYQMASASAIPCLFDKSILVKVNSIINGIQSFSMIIGPLIGAYLINNYNISYIVIINAITFLVSAIILTKLNYKHQDNADREVNNNDKLKYFILFIKNNELIKNLTIILSITALALGIQNISFVFFVKEIMKETDNILGILISLQGFGSVIGALIGVILFKKSKLETRLKLLNLSYVFAAVSVAIYLLFHNIFIVSIFIMIEGILFCWIFTLIHTILQENLKKEDLGKIFGIVFCVESIFMAISMSISGYLIEKIGVFNVYLIITFELVLVSLIIFIKQKKIINSMLNRNHKKTVNL